MLLVAAVALLLALRPPAPLEVDLGAPGDKAFIANFYQPEHNAGTSFRWSGPGSRLLLHGAGNSALDLRLRLNGDALASQGHEMLWLQRNEQTLAAFAAAPGWRVYRVLLPPNAAPRAAPLALVSAVERPGPADDRYLGVPLDWFAAEPLSPQLPLLPLLLLLALAGALLAAVVALRVGEGIWKGAAGRSWPVRLRLPPVARRVLPVVLLWLLAHLLLLLPLPLEWRGVGALLLLALPGALLARLLFRHEHEPLERAFLMLCGALALPALLLLALQAVPGPLPWWAVLLSCDALTVALLVVLLRLPAPTTAQPAHVFRLRSPSVALALVVLVGAVLRLTLLGSSEFQGDESRAILMAAGVHHGQDEILLLRPKGPVEVLIPLGLLALVGQMNEWLARLPFALAGIGVLPGCYLLARRLFGSSAGGMALSGAGVGLLAAGILALDGFMVAFARIVQYQSVILVLMIGALWCGWRFYEGAEPAWRYLLGAAVLAAVAMLSHYDGAFVLPALAWLALAGGWRRGWRGAAWARGLALPLLVGAGLLLSFYLPFVLNEHFSATTADYLAYRLREGDQSSLSFNNLPLYGRLATFYGTTFQLLAWALALLGGVLAWLAWYVRPRWLASVLALLLLAGCGVLLWRPAAFELPGGLNWALLAFGLPLLALALAPAAPAALRLLVLWFAAPFIAMAFLIAEPRTHFYTMHPAAALLMALALAQLIAWLHARRLRLAQMALAGAGVALVALALPYLAIAFVRQQPEYLRDFPASRPALYRASYGDALPTDAGYFAFPQRDGWKVAGMLYQAGVLRGDYASNKKPLITNWYLRGVYRCNADPAYFFLARSESYILPTGYDLFGTILVDNRRMMDIYSRAPADPVPAVFELRDYAAAFDALEVGSFPTQRFLFDVVPQYHLDVAWQRGVHLTGYDLFGAPYHTGEQATFSLYWQAAQPLDPAYELVVELLDSSGTPVQRAAPHCNPAPPAAWHSQSVSDTAYTLDLPATLPAGTYHLRAGIRHTQSGEWLPLADGAQWLMFAPLKIES